MADMLIEAPYAIASGNGRVFRFTGVLLSTSDSRKPGSNRWITFALYRTTRGTYVMSRVGHSLYYHRPDCEVVERNDLEIGVAKAGGVPCEICSPNAELEPVCPELPRHWAALFHDAQSVIQPLRRTKGQAEFVTKVAARLIEAASVHDRALAEAWLVQRVD